MSSLVRSTVTILRRLFSTRLGLAVSITDGGLMHIAGGNCEDDQKGIIKGDERSRQEEWNKTTFILLFDDFLVWEWCMRRMAVWVDGFSYCRPESRWREISGGKKLVVVLRKKLAISFKI